MVIENQQRYDEIVAFAQSIGDTSLENCLNRLKQWECNTDELQVTIHLSGDFEPHSFFFSEERSDGRRGLCGGVVYHGQPGEADNSGCITVGKTYGWEIHT
jgi:hypothetical protein